MLVFRLEEVAEAPVESMASIVTPSGLPTADVLADAPVRDNSSFAGRHPELASGDVAAFYALGRRDALGAAMPCGGPVLVPSVYCG